MREDLKYEQELPAEGNGGTSGKRQGFLQGDEIPTWKMAIGVISAFVLVFIIGILITIL